MKTSDFSFSLPDNLIAQFPPEKRGESRLLILDKKGHKLIHSSIKNFPEYIDSNTLVVFNNTRVRKARIYAKKAGKEFDIAQSHKDVEFLLIEKRGKKSWEIISRKSKKIRVNDKFFLKDGLEGKITKKEENSIVIEFSREITDEYLSEYGHVPLPPYIKREDSRIDETRYQTIFAEKIGSIAAPTAGLHFTDNIMKDLKEKNVEITYIDLNVGMGTFVPIRTERIEDHIMHNEIFHITKKAADIINYAKKKNKKILAVGTTVVRALESAYIDNKILPGDYNTSLFIYPGKKFKIVDQLFTNFHTPKSTLLVLVSAFAGRNFIKNAYDEAIRMKYNFFSYGDAMLIK